MRGDEKVLVTHYAAHEIGKPRVDYPLEQCLIFYLSERGFQFPAYSFSPIMWPDYGDCLVSRQLEKDIDSLVGRRLLHFIGSPSVEITDLGVQEAKPLVHRLEEEGEQYEELKRVVEEALTSDWRIFLEKCYIQYIRREYSLHDK